VIYPLTWFVLVLLVLQSASVSPRTITLSGNESFLQ
jgi:hypothetical protein